jgi:energy-coupling factor transporter ATP-binding protein EcfA2
MVDFYQILSRETKSGILELYPDFIVGRSRDLMVQGRTFYAIWDEEKGLWSRDEYDVQRLVDEDLHREADELFQKTEMRHQVRDMRSFGSQSWAQFRKYIAHIADNSVPLDTRVVFANTEVKKTDYASKTLPYSMAEGDTSAWNELIGTLYNPEERAKIEWAIGSVISGDSKKIQKFLVFYGPPASGKSTVLNIIGRLFEGYTTTFDGRALGQSNSAFATEAFKHNPLVAIQHDGDLSRLEDNARLNSIIAHEDMMMNEKYKPSYTSKVDAMLFVGSNQPVKISDAKSGIIRRLIDVHPTGVFIPNKHYHALMAQIDFDLGAVAHHCLSVFLEMGRNYYNAYRPLEMMLQTDIFFNFIEAYYDLFKGQDGTTLKQAYALYKEYCNESGIDRPLPQYKMREELRNYFDVFRDRGEVEGRLERSVYTGFSANKFKEPVKDSPTFSLVLEEKKSLLDELLGGQPAQYARKTGTPQKRWGSVTTTLADIETGKTHFVKVPDNHIVIDFDLKGNDGERSLERNLEVASLWPATYAELSQSGSGVHLHYIYTGEVADLAKDYSEGIEVKVYSGDSALRRKLTRCNAVPVATISSGLPLKPKKEKMLKTKTITSEKGLRDLIARNLRKEIHPGTKPSVDFIKKVLDDAYESGMKYDVTDLRNKIIAFANNSTNQAQVALKVVKEMQFASDNGDADAKVEVDDDRIVFFDVETYLNLFVVCWKFQGDDTVVKMVNPKPQEIESLFRLKLVGFYNRRYDNHMLYAASLGKSNEELFRLSEKLIEGNRNAPYGAAYNLSYADIWDFSTEKKSLKKFEIDLGILHMELDIPWDQPVDEKDWERVVDYCVNDVRATEAVFEDRKGDFVARQILAELSGLTVNDTTQRHTAKILFGDNKHPQREFVYTDLSKDFPGYKFEMGKSSYRDEDPGEGGYVYAEPGMYENVVVLDVVSMHPASIEIMNVFGPYTKKYSELKEARVAIKRGDYDKARKMLDGRLAQFLEGAEDEEVGRHGTDLSYALRIALNIVYGLTSASFDNPFKDNRNIDNIVAKRGALFMIDLKKYLQNEGIQVIHIKTDSVKIPNTDKKTIQMVIDFGKQYGYDFDHEATYDRFCLVNDAVYVGGVWPVPWEDPYPRWEWTAVGAQFQHPYVFKTLFSEEPVEFKDYCEGRSVVKGTMYLDRTGEEEHDHTRMRHIGKTGLFVPVNAGGGVLWRYNEGKYYAVSGTKGHLWMEADVAAGMGDKLQVDMGYFNKLRDEGIKTIEQFGSFESFVRKGK